MDYTATCGNYQHLFRKNHDEGVMPGPNMKKEKTFSDFGEIVVVNSAELY